MAPRATAARAGAHASRGTSGGWWSFSAHLGTHPGLGGPDRARRRPHHGAAGCETRLHGGSTIQTYGRARVPRVHQVRADCPAPMAIPSPREPDPATLAWAHRPANGGEIPCDPSCPAPRVDSSDLVLRTGTLFLCRRSRNYGIGSVCAVRFFVLSARSDRQSETWAVLPGSALSSGHGSRVSAGPAPDPRSRTLQDLTVPSPSRRTERRVVPPTTDVCGLSECPGAPVHDASGCRQTP